MAVKVFERILTLFEAEGIKTLFGIPDPNFVHMFLTAEQRGWSVVAPHHEECAGFMARAASRMTGKPGLCIGTLGPGIANLAGAMIVRRSRTRPSFFLAASGRASPSSACVAAAFNSSSSPDCSSPR